MQPSQRQRLLFCHIPKSGGSTMGGILHQNLGQAFFPYYGLWDRFTFVERDVHQMFLLHPNIVAVGSHMLCLRFPLECEEFSFFAFSFVRDPVERAVSHYNYTKKLNPQLVHPDINQFFAKVFEEKEDGRFFNNQFRFLSGRDQKPLSFEHLRDLLEKQRILLAPLDRFDHACILLERRFPDLLPNAAYPYRKNTTVTDQEISDEVRQLILENNPLDRELYEMTQQFFAETWKEEIGDSAAAMMEDFRRRCEQNALSLLPKKPRFPIPVPYFLKSRLRGQKQ